MRNLLSRFQASLVLNAIQGVGPVAYKRLEEAFEGDLPAALVADSKTLYALPGIGKVLGDKILTWEKQFDLAKEEKQLEKLGIEFVPAFDARYPMLLKTIPDAPIGLYVLGDVASIKTSRMIAMVGTRKASLYGTSMAQHIAKELAFSRWTVVSGLARGIDTAAHLGALSGNGSTIAVLGCGADIVYPPENLGLYRKIAESGGAILSEFPLGRVADKRSFPQRNRIIAGLSAGMLIVESDEKGGSMLSANFAAECGRTVFALPGRVDQINSRGCHKLIREGATLITDAKDIIEELESVASQPLLPLELAGDSPSFSESTGVSDVHVRETLASLPPDATRIFDLLASGDALFPDDIIAKTHLSAASVASNLLMLELERLVARKLDGSYEKLIF